MSAPAQIELDRVQEIAAGVDAERVLIVTGKSRRFLDLLLPELGDRTTQVFDGARTHVPEATIEEAEAVFAELGPELLVALGGGAPIGLSKILRLRHGLPFLAIATTYSGSEMTSIWGSTKGNEKKTGRDEGVRPSWVVYDGRLTVEMPIALSVQSLMNAMAHPLSALSTGALDADLATRSHEVIGGLLSVIEALLREPQNVELRRKAHEWAGEAAKILDRSAMGQHHKAAHFLGGRFQLPHAALHSVLLPSSVRIFRREHPELLGQTEVAVGSPRLELRLLELLSRAGAPTSLEELGLDAAAIGEALRDAPEALAPIVTGATPRSDGR